MLFDTGEGQLGTQLGGGHWRKGRARGDARSV